MRLVAVSVVKNEADIIEAFVRHTRAWVDHHLIFDHDSTDGTREILGALQAEGLPLSLFTDDALGNLQQARSNILTRRAARDLSADWVLPLDADEILVGPGGRPALEGLLAGGDQTRHASLPLLNYFPTPTDPAGIANPLLRLQHCESTPPRTRKIMVPQALALDETVLAGKGSHELLRGTVALPDRPLPDGFHLAHLALRSPQHQVLRVVLAELQKLSRGAAHAGLDVHYRLGFQLLAENPAAFLQAVCPPPTSLRRQPIPYAGGPLRHDGDSLQGWSRVARALLPYLEKLATSHGRLLDAAGHAEATPASAPIRPLTVAEIPGTVTPPAGPAFAGFSAEAGWCDREGPVPAAFLPEFHWGLAPSTLLVVDSPTTQSATLTAEVLTYVENQQLSLEINGSLLLQHQFTGTNHLTRLTTRLPLRAGRNELVWRYRECLVTAYDPRRLAVIFLGLRIAAVPAD